MFLDLQTMFSGSVAANGTKTGDAITATAISANVLDLRQSGALALADEGLNPDEAWLYITALTAANGADAAKTLTITLESDSAVGLGTTPVVHWSSGAILGSAILAGTVLARIPLPSADYQRYLGLRYTVSAAFTAFAVTANITPDIQRNKIYPTGFTIDV